VRRLLPQIRALPFYLPDLLERILKVLDVACGFLFLERKILVYACFDAKVLSRAGMWSYSSERGSESPLDSSGSFLIALRQAKSNASWRSRKWSASAAISCSIIPSKPLFERTSTRTPGSADYYDPKAAVGES
jgi:hypothetical protein